MSVLYIDTSALAQLYVREAGSDTIRERAQAAEAVVSSVLVWPECLAMLARRRREDLLTTQDHAELRRRFYLDYAAMVLIDVDGRVLELVETMLERHTLRGADAVHLASAALLAEAGLVVEFACSDRALLAAARAERLLAFDPALP